MHQRNTPTTSAAARRQPAATSDMLCEVDAAAYIGMSRSWLSKQRMRAASDQPAYLKIGKAIRYRRDDLDRWLESRRHGPAADAA